MAQRRAPLLAFLLVACGPGAGGEGEDANRPTRLVLVTLDTLRYDAFTAETMPRTRRLAEQGLVFERFYAAAPTTQPTHATLFTGRHPWEHGVVRNGMVLPEDLPTLAEELASAGWRTEGVVASFPVHRRFGFGRGFAQYADEFTFERKGMPESWAGEETEGEHFFSIADSTTAKALAALDRLAGPRQFLWVHYFDAHNPYGDLEERPVTLHRLRTLSRQADAPELPELVARARDLYARDVARMDAELARLLERLARDADAIETHVLVTADHGESFGEDGAFGHDTRLTPEQIHVPTFLLSPLVQAGRTDEVAGTIDAYATLRALAGLSPAPQGRDLTRGEADASALGMKRHDAGSAPRFFRASRAGLLAGDGELLCVDDLASAPVPGKEAGDVRALFRRFAAELERTGASVLGDEETRRALDALGYGGE